MTTRPTTDARSTVADRHGSARNAAVPTRHDDGPSCVDVGPSDRPESGDNPDLTRAAASRHGDAEGGARAQCITDTTSGANCDLCCTAESKGWWGESSVTHCRTCHLTWRIGTKLAHCSTCHRQFSTPRNFDQHLLVDDEGSATCLDPASLKHPLRCVDGIWKGEPRPDIQTSEVAS